MPINELSNTAKIVFDGADLLSNTVSTLLQLPPTITKAVDITLGAKIGDILTYTVIITNLNLSTIASLPFSDPLPEGCAYVPDSFKVNGVTASASYNGTTRVLSHTIANIAALGVVTITFRVEVVEPTKP